MLLCRVNSTQGGKSPAVAATIVTAANKETGHQCGASCCAVVSCVSNAAAAATKQQQQCQQQQIKAKFCTQTCN